MSQTLSLSSGVPGRYATAVFNLFREEGQLKVLAKDVSKLAELIDVSNDFKKMIESPIIKREEQAQAVSAVAKKIKLHENTDNLLQLMARKGRVSILPRLVDDIGSLLENERDEISVEVISAETLNKDQIGKLEQAVSKILNQKAFMRVKLDRSLIGGMIVKIGSRMIDTTIKSKLVKLQNIMKEVN
jgi:F-type H+-transporting ATPase subunit delta